jgi:hypothetical protein
MVATTASAGADDDAIEELEVILGHPFLKASGDVSLFKAMGAAHWMLIQTHDVLHRDRGDIDDKQRCLLLWVSLLRKQMASEKEKAKARQKHLHVMEILLDRKQAVAEKLDAEFQKLLADTKDLYTTAEAWADSTTKKEEDLTVCTFTGSKRERVVADKEHDMKEPCGTRMKQLAVVLTVSLKPSRPASLSSATVRPL